MASLPSKLIFPSWALEDEETHDEFSTAVIPSNGAEVTDAKWSRSRFVITLSGGLCTSAGRRELKAASRVLQGRRHKCWFRRYYDDEWELKDEFLGAGDGVRTSFQARLCDFIQGREVGMPVFALDHDIPPLGLDPYQAPYTQTRFVEVRVDGQLQTLAAHYSVQREGGLITFNSPPSPGARVSLSGGFFAVVRLNQEFIKTKPSSAGWWKISEDVLLIEPKGVNGAA